MEDLIDSCSFWLPFGLLFWSPWPFKKQLKVCNYRHFQGFGPFQTGPFFKTLSWTPLFHTFFTLGDVLAPLLWPRAGKGDEMGAPMEPQNHLKSLKKVIENKLFFLLVSFGAQGLPGITF